MGYPKGPAAVPAHKDLARSVSPASPSSSTAPTPDRATASERAHQEEQKLLYSTFHNSCFSSESI